MVEQRVKTGLALTQKHLNFCDENLRKAEVNFRNSFVEKAIEYYAGHLNAEQNARYFEGAFASKAQQKVEQIGKSLGTGQFKIAVELALISHILASQAKISGEDFRRLRDKCEYDIRRLEGVQKFEEAYKFQHSEDK
ncbi:MAG: hypothetical protein AWM53_00878 [Candidatus Dichloromethanomonas elyunquensis]|nr:MAG: hypothetical protein AWM53_00878 [Candidatus Dichloromethanomonas elyunquensis]